MILKDSHSLDRDEIAQYVDLIQEANSEPFFYGTPLLPAVPRQVIFDDGRIVGAFEYGTIEYEGRSYQRTNRPYTMKEYRGRGIMSEILGHWYTHRRPAMCWIDDENISSIRLFQGLGFRQSKSLFHKNKNGHVYLLTQDA